MSFVGFFDCIFFLVGGYGLGYLEYMCVGELGGMGMNGENK